MLERNNDVWLLWLVAPMTDEQILLLVADIKAGRKGDVLASPVPLPFRWRVWAWMRGLTVVIEPEVPCDDPSGIYVP